ncbi:carboxymuconolactone decarboxylase family protein [Nevskia soli]|uniref:carboxymuconolactone decarboxylase family protein n=1 Tax=Nevskia soli TaxID=418856 RepID=UPI0004A74C2F|nr:carboxymuconolactone decarboxylase family protein [Nevskia soli]
MSEEMFEKGLAMRRKVLGDAYVDSVLKGADEFSQPLQEYVTKYCWGDVWNRPGLELRTRSLLNLAMLAALNRPHELKIHLRGALNNGVSKQEISEVFLQVAAYCGAPAAMDAIRVAGELFRELGK